MYYAMLTFAVILLAFNFALTKLYQKKNGVSEKAGYLFNSMVGLFTALIFFASNGFTVNITPFSAIMGFSYAALVTFYTIIGFKILEYGTMALYTLFLMVGGMTIPYIYGLLFLDEKFSYLRTLALFIIMAGVALANYSGEKLDKKRLMMCIAVFVLNGFVSVTSKLHQIEAVYDTVDTQEFVIITGVAKFIFAGILYLGAKKEESENKKLPFRFVLLLTAGSAAIVGLSSFVQLIGAANLPATVIYPFVTGGTIVFSSLAGMIFYREKITLKTSISIFLCFVGTLMFL